MEELKVGITGNVCLLNLICYIVTLTTHIVICVKVVDIDNCTTRYYVAINTIVQNFSILYVSYM